jgi:hypothetical protein
VNIAQISNVSNFSEHKLYFIANQNGVRYSDSTSYFKKYSSSKCKQTVCLHYGLDFHFKNYVGYNNPFVRTLLSINFIHNIISKNISIFLHFIIRELR